MEVDEKVICPHCGQSECFHEHHQTETGTTESFMCVGCGYTTTSLNEEGSEMIKQYEEITANLIKDLRWVDPATKLVWYPVVLNFHETGMMFPDGTSIEDWGWRAALAVDVEESEQHKYPIKGKKDEFFKKRIDMENSELFDKDQFRQAAEYVKFL